MQALPLDARPPAQPPTLFATPEPTREGVSPTPAWQAAVAPPLPPASALHDGTACQPIPRPPALPLAPLGAKPRVLLTSVRVDEATLFSNGLHQNVYNLYRMLEALGYEPIVVVDSMEKHPDSPVHRVYRTIDVAGFDAAPFPIAAYVELGMSCDPTIRRVFKAMGAKTIKVYWGNVLFIDTETPVFYPTLNFSHHVSGELDEIWTSPHYDLHAEYCGAINGIRTRVRIAPYIWDPQFVRSVGEPYEPLPLAAAPAAAFQQPRTFVVMEPNISHQKSSWVPLLLLEEYYRRHPQAVEAVLVFNGAKMAAVPYAAASLLPALSLARDGRVAMLPRAAIVDVARRLPPGTVVVQHQNSNAYNYSTLEWLTMQFPLVHNVSQFAEYAYHYSAADVDSGVAALERAVTVHDANLPTYKAQAALLAWRFSPNNPANQAAWRDMLAPVAGAPPAGVPTMPVQPGLLRSLRTVAPTGAAVAAR
jgi:hypothetical protein